MRKTISANDARAIRSRVEWLVKAKGLTAEYVESRTGYSPMDVQALVAAAIAGGKERDMVRLASLFRADSEWLATGNGFPFDLWSAQGNEAWILAAYRATEESSSKRKLFWDLVKHVFAGAPLEKLNCWGDLHEAA
jgi:hypothetical protein